MAEKDTLMDAGDVISGTDTPSVLPLHTPKDLTEAVKLLKAQCEEIWKEVDKTQKELNSVKTSQAPSESTQLSIHQTKETHLRAQIAALKGAKPKVLPQNQTIQFEVHREELERSIRELQETLTLVQSSQQEVANDMEREELFKKETEQVKEAIVKKLEEAQAESEGENNLNRNSLQNDIIEEEKKINKYYKKLMKQMRDFIHVHFPEPSEAQIQAWLKSNKNSTFGSSSSEGEIASLQTILQLLLNKCIDSPHNAYIEVTDEFWPPYVELLVRCGISIRNPDNDRLIRLTPFHL